MHEIQTATLDDYRKAVSELPLWRIFELSNVNFYNAVWNNAQARYSRCRARKVFMKTIWHGRNFDRNLKIRNAVQANREFFMKDATKFLTREIATEILKTGSDTEQQAV